MGLFSDQADVCSHSTPLSLTVSLSTTDRMTNQQPVHQSNKAHYDEALPPIVGAGVLDLLEPKLPNSFLGTYCGFLIRNSLLVLTILGRCLPRFMVVNCQEINYFINFSGYKVLHCISALCISCSSTLFFIYKHFIKCLLAHPPLLRQ